MSDAAFLLFPLGWRVPRLLEATRICWQCILRCSVRLDMNSPLYHPFLRFPRGIFYLLCLLFTDCL